MLPGMGEDEVLKVTENRIRRAAQRQGLMLQKSRRRDPRAYDYGTYRLIDGRHNALVAGDQVSSYGMTLADVEETLNGRR